MDLGIRGSDTPYSHKTWRSITSRTLCDSGVTNRVSGPKVVLSTKEGEYQGFGITEGEQILPFAL